MSVDTSSQKTGNKMSANTNKNSCPEYDEVLQNIADYTLKFNDFSDEALDTAFVCLMDTLGCGFRALKFPACTQHLGTVWGGRETPDGARVPGTEFCLDPAKAAWDIGCIIRWLDFNDTWLAAEWGHPSDNLGAILAVTDYLSRNNLQPGKKPLVVQDLLQAMIKAHEIQGCLALENSFNQVGLDHVVLVKIASVAVVALLAGASREIMLSALSHAFADGQSLRTYRHAPNTGSRKSWAAGDAASRAVRLVDIAMRGEAGIHSVLTAKKWGFYDASFNSQPFRLQRDYSDYVMRNILFKVAFPAEFHAQTAVEAAITLSAQMKQQSESIERIELTTHHSAIEIISKQGALVNPADRDHCLQYMVAVALLFGELKADHYSDSFHNNHPEIDALRKKMVVKEDKRYSEEYHHPEKRSIANAVQLFFTDGSKTEKIVVEYPLGHRHRRAEAIPRLYEKFNHSVKALFLNDQAEKITNLFSDRNALNTMRVDSFMDCLIRSR